jgi:HEAT repeat protein
MKILLMVFILILSIALPNSSYGKIKKAKVEQKKVQITKADIKKIAEIEVEYKKALDKKKLSALKSKTLKLSNKAVPVLVKVMKDGSYPDKNRWMATFLLGQIMGEKSAPFIAKFSEHPSWVMRLASLKTLNALKKSDYIGVYQKGLKDKSLLVRVQALENIRQMKLKKLGPSVWAMLYDKSNYKGAKGKRKRTNIIKEVIKTVGDLKFDEAKGPMLTMIQKKKYKDIHPELDYSLGKIFGKNSPKGDMQKKKYYWSRVALSSKTI